MYDHKKGFKFIYVISIAGRYINFVILTRVYTTTLPFHFPAVCLAPITIVLIYHEVSGKQKTYF